MLPAHLCLIKVVDRNGLVVGCLTGSVSEACDSWSQGHEFSTHTGHRDYFLKDGLVVQDGVVKIACWTESQETWHWHPSSSLRPWERCVPFLGFDLPHLGSTGTTGAAIQKKRVGAEPHHCHLICFYILWFISSIQATLSIKYYMHCAFNGLQTCLGAGGKNQLQRMKIKLYNWNKC